MINFHVNVLEMIGLVTMVAFTLIVFLFWFFGVLIPNSYKKFMAWRATGYCKHSWELYNTHSFGNYADYKCNQCNTKRVMRL